ncbi:MAG: hypothetical protein ACRD8Z_29270, partial [Nitrososphaeraceae archaeon]
DILDLPDGSVKDSYWASIRESEGKKCCFSRFSSSYISVGRILYYVTTAGYFNLGQITRATPPFLRIHFKFSFFFIIKST